MKLRDYLSIPYLLEAETVETPDGGWTRRLRYPELGNFFAEHEDVETALAELERLRITEIMRLLRRGELPPAPRAPLETLDPAWLAARLGLTDLISDKLQHDVAELGLKR